MKFKTILLLVAGIIIMNHYKKKGTAKIKKKSLVSGLIDEVKKPLIDTAAGIPGTHSPAS